MTKQQRHNCILNIIEKHEIKTQEELTAALFKIGIDVTQATVSRDIKELNLIKVSSGKSGYKYATSGDRNVHELSRNKRTIFEKAVISVDYALNQVIVKTLSGMAQAAASAIDSMHISEILGTIAGDDTIMCITRSEECAKNIFEEFSKICGF